MTRRLSVGLRSERADTLGSLGLEWCLLGCSAKSPLANGWARRAAGRARAALQSCPSWAVSADYGSTEAEPLLTWACRGVVRFKRVLAACKGLWDRQRLEDFVQRRQPHHASASPC